MTSAESTQAEAIVQVATRLFAALGYDGTTTRQIAEAAGLNIATVSYHVGGKRELYLAVMENAHRVERAALESAIAEFSGRDTATLVHGIVDRYLDFCVAHRDVATLWMHRWLSDAADISDLEQRYTHPLATLVLEAVEGPGAGA
ncbi:TetR/AcrR family transcriptional regulator [Thermocatellispora tengchongensis]|uniref:TetR/AcrR family transcriptional regulator n=1 Tax=Thermocatellispora tengchongensis TaxID=1073253 RepID=UPI00363D720A